MASPVCHNLKESFLNNCTRRSFNTLRNIAAMENIKENNNMTITGLNDENILKVEMQTIFNQK